MIGWLGRSGSSTASLTAEEKKQCIDELRGRFSEKDISESWAELILEVRSWNLETATVMVQNILAWRCDNLPVTWEEVKPVMDTGAIMMLDENPDGLGVWIIHLYRLLQVDWNEDGQTDKYIRAAVYCAETMANRVREGRWIAVINCAGITIPPHSFLAKFTTVLQANYPGRLHKMLMYPVGGVIVQLVKSCLYMLKPKTRKKVDFVSTFEDLCTETGLSQEQLPGDLVDAAAAEAKKGGELVKIPAWRVKTHSHKVAVGAVVEWGFRVVGNSTIKFELRFTPDGELNPREEDGDTPTVAGGASVLKQEDRLTELRGDFKAASAGALDFVFDNTSCYIQSKLVVLFLNRNAL